MKQGTSFSFESYSIDSDSGVFAFSYRTDFADGTHIRFTERLDLPDIPLDTIDTRLLTRIFENLHLALGISYYKLHCPPAIRLGALKLNAQQAQFWETLYTKGLGEFFYRNNIDPRGLIRFPATEQEIISPISYQSDDTLLVGMGEERIHWSHGTFERAGPQAGKHSSSRPTVTTASSGSFS
jgi:hypothetical protein